MVGMAFLLAEGGHGGDLKDIFGVTMAFLEV